MNSTPTTTPENNDSNAESNEDETRSTNFIRQIIDTDVANGKNGGQVMTRFPPEPSGYLHIGHAKAICINFAIARDYNGVCNLRFDDTNPIKEETEFIDAIREDIRWLGFEWGKNEFFASDYFEQLYDWAVALIKDGQAYVDELDAEEMRTYRGTLTEPGKPSPHRDRPIEENLGLFARMRAGEFENGAYTLRAKIDMTSGNMNMRDPAMYRIQKAEHPRTGTEWCIYPLYDFAHGQGDSIEGVTHSLCSLEFEDHRPLYDWFTQSLNIHAPQQIEFARLNISHTVTQKRKLRELVDENFVSGWDDPRMPTLRGMRRRGFAPQAIQSFCEEIGVAKRSNVVQMAFFEHVQRAALNKTSNRIMAVVNPLKVVITNYPVDQVDELDAVNNPEDESAGKRKVPFGRELYIEQDDFMEDPPKKFFRLGLGREVRLRYAYFITCVGITKDDDGKVVEVQCTYDPETRGGDAPDGRRVKGTIHWVSSDHAVDATVREYDHLFAVEDPTKVSRSQKAAGKDWKSNINPDSLNERTGCKVEPYAKELKLLDRVQFERLGYYCVDQDCGNELVFNRTLTLKDSWAKQQQQLAKAKSNQKKQQQQKNKAKA